MSVFEIEVTSNKNRLRTQPAFYFNICQFKIEQKCFGCHAQKGKIFWGDCDLYECAAAKKIPHCGKCGEFPCGMLQEWASSEGTERIDNLKKLIFSLGTV